MRGRYIHGLDRWAFLGLIPIAGSLLCWRFAQREERSRFVGVFAVTAMLLLAPLAAYASVLLNRSKAPQPLVEQVQTWTDADDIRIGCWHLEHLPSLNFYVQRNIEHLREERDIACFLQYRVPVFLFLPLEDWQRVEASHGRAGRVVGRQYDMYHHTEVVVVTNR